jgi:hypothetical protein
MKSAPLVVLVGVLAFGGCRKEQEKPAPSPTPAPENRPASLDPELAELHRASTRGRKDDFEAVVSAGPVAGSLADREHAALALFSAGSPADRLAVVAVDPGNEFELALRHVVAKGGFEPAPAATPFDVEATGGLSSAAIEAALAPRLAWYEACFIPALRLDRRATGSITMRWNVGPRGDATGVWMTKSELLGDDVTKCIVRHSHGLPFPAPPQGSALVTASLQLGPRKIAGNPNLPRGLTQ